MRGVKNRHAPTMKQAENSERRNEGRKKDSQEDSQKGGQKVRQKGSQKETHASSIFQRRHRGSDR